MNIETITIEPCLCNLHNDLKNVELLFKNNEVKHFKIRSCNWEFIDDLDRAYNNEFVYTKCKCIYFEDKYLVLYIIKN